MIVRKVWKFELVVILVMACTSASAGLMENVIPVSSSERGAVVRFTPNGFRIDTVRVDGGDYHHLDFKEASPWSTTGDPLIPTGILSVIVPQEGDVNVSVEAGEYTTLDGIKPLPVPQLVEEDGLPRQDYLEGNPYRDLEVFPGRLYDAEDPGYFGEYRIVRVHLYPVQFHPAENRVRVYSGITIRINFANPSREVSSIERRQGTEYRKALVNYKTARNWRMVPKRSLAKASTLSGDVYKIPVSHEGVFRVNGSYLETAGIDLGSIETPTLKIYNNGGRELPRNFATARSDSLIENPILTFGLDDGRFDASDYILFYGQDVSGWEYNPDTDSYSHYIHHYDTRNVYWLVFNDGREGARVETTTSLTSDGAETVDTYTERYFVEQELNNPLHAGIRWYGPSFDNTNAIESYTLNLNDLDSDGAVNFRFRFKGHTSGTHRFTSVLNDQEIGNYQFVGSTVRLREDSLVGGLDGENTLSFLYSGSSSSSLAYLDWFEISYLRRLMPVDGWLRFNSTSLVGKYVYELEGFDEEPTVLDVTDISSIRALPTETMDGDYAFVDDVTDIPKSYVIFTEQGVLTPGAAERDVTSDLRNFSNGADFIIITHADFIDQAERLKTHRETQDSLSVFIADIQDVYDEFSWGVMDPTAIRDFMKHAFDFWMIRPSYLLLFGDGDYDYKNILSTTVEKRIPPFEYDGNSEAGTRASDDWYTYVSGNDNVMDFAVGRFPVQTTSEATIVVDKIIAYETTLPNGRWKSLITVVGDDEKGQHGTENETEHISLIENVAQGTIPSYFNLKKIYLTEYPEVTTAEGRRKPQAAADLVEQINQGTLIVDYSGHGNDELWAHERVFVQGRDLSALRNAERLPLFYAATCDFAHYDDPLEQSFSEDLLNTEGKGAIAVIAASRFCGAYSNVSLNRHFLRNLLDDSGISARLGDALRLGKLSVNAPSNNEMYHILGDPTMRLQIPRHQAEFTQMEPDTFKALGVVRIEGNVYREDQVYTDFSGELALEAYDSEKDVLYTTENGSRLSYVLPGNALFRGTASVEGGRFDASFVVPKDISYGGDSGRLHAYVYDESEDGVGYRDAISIGGSAAVQDGEGPEITIAFTGQEAFITGDMVTGEPELAAVIRDDQTGINITGEIGHKLMLTVDGDEKLDVTEYFHYDEGSYLEGKVTYPLFNLDEGEHLLELKAWDNANNSSKQSAVFTLVPEGDFRLEEVLNYPNPFTTTTHFTFKLSLDADVEIKVFTVDGLLIRLLDGYACSPGFNTIYWDGRDDVGDEIANGVYLYKVIARATSDSGEVSREVVGRMMIAR